LYFSPCCSHDPAPTALYTLSLHDALPIYLDHQATWLENNQLSDFMSAPVQASQAAFDDSFNAWQQDINQFVQRAGESSRMSYHIDRKSTRLNSSHVKISYAVFCLKKKKKT